MNLNELATKEDLRILKVSILEGLQIKPLLLQKKWLRSKEVEEMLGISSSGLQNMRNKGVIPFIKLEGTILYEYEEILKVLDRNKSESVFRDQ